jgi:hypothetical protein
MSSNWKQYYGRTVELILTKEHPDESDERRALVGIAEKVIPFRDAPDKIHFRLVLRLGPRRVRHIRLTDIMDFAVLEEHPNGSRLVEIDSEVRKT